MEKAGIEFKLVQYEMANGTQVTQRRAYAIEDGKKHQIKNMDAWATVENRIDSYAQLNFMPDSEPMVQPAVASAADAPRKLHAMVHAEDLADDLDAAPAQAVAANRVSLKERFSAWKDGLSERFTNRRKVILGAAAGALALIGVNAAANYSPVSAAETTTSAPAESPSTTAKATTSTTEAAPKMTQAELEAKYGNATGEHGVHEIGNFVIDPSNPEQSKQNFYTELRHNPDALAFWMTCLDTATPGYDACVANPETLAEANQLATQYQTMELSQKATVAEGVIGKFEKLTFKGITTESGAYYTVGIRDGKLVPMVNERDNDLRMNWMDENGNEFQNRSCDQVTKPIKKPTPTTTPTSKPPVTTTTEKPHDTTTTTKPPTSTTKPPTTTTKPPTTTTKPPTTTTKPPTTTSKPPTTTTKVTLPKTPPTQPKGEVTTTVKAGPVTPEHPTTSTVAQPTTQPTRPADTVVSTTAPEKPVDQPPVNRDGFLGEFGFPLDSGEIAAVSFGVLGLASIAVARKKSEKQLNGTK